MREKRDNLACGKGSQEARERREETIEKKEDIGMKRGKIGRKKKRKRMKREMRRRKNHGFTGPRAHGAGLFVYKINKTLYVYKMHLTYINAFVIVNFNINLYFSNFKIE